MDYLFLLVAATLGAYAVFFSSRKAAVGFAVVLAGMYVHWLSQDLVVARVGEVDVFVYDALALVLTGAILLRLPYLLRRLSSPRAVLVVFMAYALGEMVVITWSWLEYGPSSFQVSRAAVYLVLVITYFASFDIGEEDLRGFYGCFSIYCGLTLLLAGGRVAGLAPLPTQTVEYVGSLSYVSVRYLANYQSLALAFMFCSLLILRFNERITNNVLFYSASIITLAVVALIPQRGVWIVLAVSLVFIAFRYTRKVIAYAVVATTLVALLVPLTATNGSILQTQAEEVIAASQEPFMRFAASTAGVRVLDWQELVSASVRSGRVLTGLGYYTGLARFVAGSYRTYGVHNILVGKFVYGGIVLMLLLLAFWVALLLTYPRVVKSRIVPECYVDIVWICAAGMMLFSMSSVSGYELGLPLGIALGLGLAAQRPDADASAL